MNGQYNVLFLCTGNSARSILAETIANQLGHGRFQAFSAGSHPKGAVHPMALEILSDIGFPTAGLRSKSWDEFAVPEAPVMDFVITVCDRAAGEICPIWPGHPMTAHWSVTDPATETSDPARSRWAFQQALHVLQQRISLMLALPFDALDRLATETRLAQIGQSPLSQSA